MSVGEQILKQVFERRNMLIYFFKILIMDEVYVY